MSKERSSTPGLSLRVGLWSLCCPVLWVERGQVLWPEEWKEEKLANLLFLLRLPGARGCRP